jgi:hypothetical protein
MNEPSRPIPIRPSRLEHHVGRVAAVEGGAFVVHTSESRHHALRALSCLVAPKIGDLVAVLTSATDTSYVIAVLERTDGDAVRLSVPGDVTLEAASGSLDVRARDGVKVTGGKSIGLASPRLSVHAGAGDVTVSRLDFLGTTLRAQVDRVDLLGRVMTKVVEHVRETVVRSFRSVTELDQLRAARIDYAAEQNVAIRGANAVVTAQELVKMDAEQVHIG